MWPCLLLSASTLQIPAGKMGWSLWPRCCGPDVPVQLWVQVGIKKARLVLSRLSSPLIFRLAVQASFMNEYKSYFEGVEWLQEIFNSILVWFSYKPIWFPPLMDAYYQLKSRNFIFRSLNLLISRLNNTWKLVWGGKSYFMFLSYCFRLFCASAFLKV